MHSQVSFLICEVTNHVVIMPLHLQIIMSKPAGGPKPKDNPNWDED